MITGIYKLIANEGLWQNVTSDQVRLDVDTTLAPASIELPLLSAIDNAMEVEIIIVDAKANAGANNITITPALTPVASIVTDIAVGSIKIAGDKTGILTPGIVVTLAGLGANNGPHPVVSATFDSLTNKTTVLLAAVVVVPLTAQSTASYAPNSINNAQSFVVNTNGGIAIVKVGNGNRWTASKS